MKTASYTLLPYTTFGTPTGNYDGIEDNFTSDPVKAAAYYIKGTGIQTVSWFLKDFDGTIIIQATLDAEEDSENYFQISDKISSRADAVIQSEIVEIEEDVTLEVKDTGPRLSKYLSPEQREKIIESYKARKMLDAKQLQPNPPAIKTVEIQVFPTVPSVAPITENKAINIEGNYTWIRVLVQEFTAGKITKMSLGY